LLEACVPQYALRPRIVQQGARLEAVEAELVAGGLNYRAHSGSREAAASVGCIDPIADARALERAANDAAEIEASDDVGAAPQNERDRTARGQTNEPLTDIGGLPFLGEELVCATGLPRLEVLAIAQVCGSERGAVAG